MENQPPIASRPNWFRLLSQVRPESLAQPTTQSAPPNPTNTPFLPTPNLPVIRPSSPPAALPQTPPSQPPPPTPPQPSPITQEAPPLLPPRAITQPQPAPITREATPPPPPRAISQLQPSPITQEAPPQPAPRGITQPQPTPITQEAPPPPPSPRAITRPQPSPITQEAPPPPSSSTIKMIEPQQPVTPPPPPPSSSVIKMVEPPQPIKPPASPPSPRETKPSSPTPTPSPKVTQFRSLPPIQPKRVIVQEESTNGSINMNGQHQADSSAESNGRSPAKAAATKKEEAEMSIITLAGNNMGAYMELARRKQQAGHSLNPAKESKIMNTEGKSGNVATKPATKSPTKTMASMANSNVQSVNNSILFNTPCAAGSPGVHISFTLDCRKGET